MVSPARIRNGFVARGIAEYAKRIGRYARLELVQARGGASRRARGDANSNLLRTLETSRGVNVALDERGDVVDSAAFAEILKENNDLNFLIGGPDGLDTRVLDLCHRTISLTRLTLTSELAELILMEQIYRAFTMLNSHPYHRK